MGIRNLSTASISTGAKRSKMWDQATVITNPAWESISTVTLTSSNSSIVFSSISSQYKHLQIRGVSRCTYGGTGGQSNAYFRLNNDSGANYRQHYMRGNGSTYSVVDIGGTNINAFQWENPWNSMTLHGPVIITIADYQNTNKHKSITILNGADWNGASNNQNIYFQEGIWKSNSAVTSINFLQSTSVGSDGDFASGTTLALYGLKG